MYASKHLSSSVQIKPVTDAVTIDWRADQVGDVYRPFSVAFDLHYMMTKYLNTMNFDTGVFDIIIDKVGRYVFLECNTHGQWLALENVARIPPNEVFISTMKQKSETLL